MTVAEALQTAEGETLDLGPEVDRDFAAAMAAPPADAGEHPGPPDVAPVDPAAPFGRKVDGTPKKAPGGRPPGARVTTSAQAGRQPKDHKGKGGPAAPAEPAGQRYARDLGETFAGMAMALAVLPIPNPDLAARCRVQAHILRETGDGLAAGVGTVAEHNGIVRWGVEKITQGGGAWVFPAALAIAPFAMQTALLWRSPVDEDMHAFAMQIETQARDEFRAAMGQVIPGEAEPAEAGPAAGPGEAGAAA